MYWFFVRRDFLRCSEDAGHVHRHRSTVIRFGGPLVPHECRSCNVRAHWNVKSLPGCVQSARNSCTDCCTVFCPDWSILSRKIERFSYAAARMSNINCSGAVTGVVVLVNNPGWAVPTLGTVVALAWEQLERSGSHCHGFLLFKVRIHDNVCPIFLQSCMHAVLRFWGLQQPALVCLQVVLHRWPRPNS